MIWIIAVVVILFLVGIIYLTTLNNEEVIYNRCRKCVVCGLPLTKEDLNNSITSENICICKDKRR